MHEVDPIKVAAIRDFPLPTNLKSLKSFLGLLLALNSQLQPHERNCGVTKLEALGIVWAAKIFLPYLYGNQCDAFTHHVALKSLVCNPQPSGKLAWWGMAIYELDLQIHHQSGRKNTNVDALSQYPVLSMESTSSNHQVLKVVAATSLSWESAKGREPTLSTLQLPASSYCGLPGERRTPGESLWACSNKVTIHDWVRQDLEGDPPMSQREKIFHKAHGGRLGTHLHDAKIHGELSRHY